MDALDGVFVDYGHVSIPLTACPPDLGLILWAIGHNSLSLYQRLSRSIRRLFFLSFWPTFPGSNLQGCMLLSPQLPSNSASSFP